MKIEQLSGYWVIWDEESGEYQRLPVVSDATAADLRRLYPSATIAGFPISRGGRECPPRAIGERRIKWTS